MQRYLSPKQHRPPQVRIKTKASPPGLKGNIRIHGVADKKRKEIHEVYENYKKYNKSKNDILPLLQINVQMLGSQETTTDDTTFKHTR